MNFALTLIILRSSAEWNWTWMCFIPDLKIHFPWLAETMDVKKEQNFFEGRVTEYQKSSALSEVADDEL